MIQAFEIPQLTMNAEEATAFDLHLQKIEGMEASALMKNAGRALALLARTHAQKVGARTVLALAGPGNNGGDAWVAARQLQASGGFVVTGWAPLGMPHSPEGPAGEAARQALKEIDEVKTEEGRCFLRFFEEDERGFVRSRSRGDLNANEGCDL